MGVGGRIGALLAAAAFGCAHAEPTIAAACIDGDGPDCVEASVEVERETKAAVERADRSRRRAAFASTIRRWRRDLEARTASTARRQDGDDPGLAATGEPSDDGLGGSPLDLDLTVLSRVPSASVPATSADASTRPAPPVLLASARCLLADDLPLLEARVRSARAEGRPGAAQLALAWVDATDLEGRVGRASGAAGPDCDDPEVRAGRASMRALIGPAPLSDGDVAGHARGLRRLDQELQGYADLPPPRL